MRVRCPGTGKPLDVPDEMRGRNFNCPQCGRVHKAPGGAPAPPTNVTQPPPPPPPRQGIKRASSSPERRKRRSRARPSALTFGQKLVNRIVGLILTLVGGGIGLGGVSAHPLIPSQALLST